MNYRQNKLSMISLLFLSICLMPNASAKSIPVHSLAKAPLLDGDNVDWSHLPFNTIPLRKTKPEGQVDIQNVAIRGGIYRRHLALESIPFQSTWACTR